MAPAPNLAENLRADLIAAAIRLAESVSYTNIGTIEFLVNATADSGRQSFAFIEANARLQVEHTVTEAVMDVDLVQAQIRLAAGETIQHLGLDTPGASNPRGFAIQARINMERLNPDGSVHPSGGTLTAYEVPGGPGIRTDGYGYAGYETNPAFDSLLAKVTVHSPSADFTKAISRTTRAISEFRIEGITTTIPFLQNLLQHPDVIAWRAHTRFVDEHLGTQKPNFATSSTARRKQEMKKTHGQRVWPEPGSTPRIPWLCSRMTRPSKTIKSNHHCKRVRHH